METGIFIRARDEDGNYRSFDIGDPGLPWDSLVLWIASKDEDYLFRLVTILLQQIREYNYDNRAATTDTKSTRDEE